ncbi:MAG TPA: type II secretion system protein GspK [Terriglobales bacterium]|nr:type II secretion system protein GspK [Terriglobales bacterium]
MSSAGNQRGIALVTVLLVLSLLTIATLQFAFSTQVYSHLARNSVNGLQASLLARSGLNMGEAVLLYDVDPQFDSFLEEWCPEAGPTWCRVDESLLELPDKLRLRIHIIDEGGKFNINLTRPNLTEYKQKQQGTHGDRVLQYEYLQAAFRTLLEGVDADPNAADRLAEYWNQVLQEFIGVDPAEDGSNVDQSVNQQTQRASQIQAMLNQRNFPSLDDANVVLGLDPRVLHRLRKFATALPFLTASARVNVNTAPREVLEAVLGDAGAVDSLVFQRETAPLQMADINSATQGLEGNQRAAVNRMLGVTSSWYRVIASAVVNADPLTGEGGLARTASVVVRRGTGAPRPRGGNSGAPPWTLTRLDWQKEGGAVLFEESSDGSGEQPDPEDDTRASF